MEGEGWVNAEDLELGDEIRQADGTTGEVEAVAIEQTQQEMYNLTVDEAHTFFVGEGQWLVHNAGVCPVTCADSAQLNMARMNATSPGERQAIDMVMTRTSTSYIDMESHVASVMYYSDAIAVAMRKSEADRILLARGALLHDIGKNDPLITWLYNSPDIWSVADKTVGQVHVWSGAAQLRAFGVDPQVVRFAQLHHPDYRSLSSFGQIEELIQIMTAGDQLSAGLVPRAYKKIPNSPSQVMGWLQGYVDNGQLMPKILKVVQGLPLP